MSDPETTVNPRAYVDCRGAKERAAGLNLEARRANSRLDGALAAARKAIAKGETPAYADLGAAIAAAHIATKAVLLATGSTTSDE